MKKLLLKCGLSPGDIVMLTAAVRDLHLAHPGRFLTGVRTSGSAIWDNNPYVSQFSSEDLEVESIECSYPLINRSNHVPYHCLHGFASFLADRLGVQIPLTRFRGDIHISELEKSWMSQIHELTGEDTPFWIVAAGGKFDITIKWWESTRYQQVVDYFRGRIQFVQVGSKNDYHPRLNGVIDLRGKTNIRQLVRLVYHSQGVLCPVTSVMHLAAAIEFKGKQLKNRPCVVVAGGREPMHWEAYPHHQFIHTNGALPCCRQGGCWKARTVPLDDGDERDTKLCVSVTHGLPQCMDMIAAEEVIRRIELYYHGGALSYLTKEQAQAAEIGVQKTQPEKRALEPLVLETARGAMEQYIATIPEYVPKYTGRGIVICAGGLKYFPCAWVAIKMLRHLGCHLPVQVWHLGEKEFDDEMEKLLSPLGVECVDARRMRKQFPARILNGWEIKAYSILHSPFQEVLLLDADNVGTVNPEFLFDTPEFKQTGAIFWPDYGRFDAGRLIWKICGIPYQDEPEFETGQIVVDKQRCWSALCLSMWINENSDFYYSHIHGDKDTFHLAFRKLKQPYSMPSRGIHSLDGVMCQHDFAGNRIFQHRNAHKWQISSKNKQLSGFLFEDVCLEFLCELREKWSGKLGSVKLELVPA